MIRHLLTAALTTTALTAVAPAAHAQLEGTPGYQAGHFYIAGGLDQLTDAGFSNNRNFATQQIVELETEPGSDYGFHGALGWHMGNGFRVEFEGSHRPGDVENFTNTPINPSTSQPFTATGDIDLSSLMVNFYYDQPIIERRLSGYVGGGVGVTMLQPEVRYDGTINTVRRNSSGTVLATSSATGIDENKYAASFQVKLGLVLHATDNLAFYGGYRGFYFSGVDYDDTIQEIGDEFFHGAEAGVRITF